MVTELRVWRGCTLISLDDAPSMRVRTVHFEKRPLEIGDEIDADAYLNHLAALQFADAYETALSSLDFCARAAKELERACSARAMCRPQSKPYWIAFAKIA